MENKYSNNTGNTGFNARWVLIVFCALLLCIILTFGFTLAYFGGRSNGLTAQMTLKAGIAFKPDGTNGEKYVAVDFNYEYMVPGTSVNTFCLATVTSGVSNYENTATNGLLRVLFGVTGDLNSIVTIETTYVDVYLGSLSTDMVEDNKIGRLIKAADNYWYLTKNGDITEVLDTTELYELDCKGSNGVVSVVFYIPLTIGDFTNDDSGKATSFTANFEVIQSEYYDYSGQLPKTYQYAKPIFDSSAGLSN